MQKPNVLVLVSYHFLPAKMGGQKGIASFCNYFANYVNLVCVSTENNDGKEAKNYTLLNILSNNSLKRYTNVLYFFTLKRLIKQYNITHLQIEHPYYGWLAILLKHCTGVKLIIHSHNIEALRFKSIGKWWWKILWHYEKITHQQANYNFFISDEDKAYAIANYALQPSTCITATYGIDWNTIPSDEQKIAAKKYVQQKHNILPSEKILLFNGTFDYAPNANALQLLLYQILPLINQSNSGNYRLLICGKRIEQSILETTHNNTLIVGFVDDIEPYFLATDIFLNPVVDGGGIKTKLVEALGYNMPVISFSNGAIGVPTNLNNGQLTIIEDGNVLDFAQAVNTSLVTEHTNTISANYFNYFYWDNIAKRAAQFIHD